MNIAEMRQREPFAETLVATLAKCWSIEFGTPVTVVAGEGTGQVWRERRPFGAFTTGSPARPCREFLRDSFRFTPVAWRLPGQWLLGTLGATRQALMVGAGDAIRVSPAIPSAADRVIVPGNLRVRVFDFDRGVVRVAGKVGFTDAGFRREVAVRSGGISGPFPAITQHDVSAGWFEEPILDALSLPRCPGRANRREALSAALAALDKWSAPTGVAADAAEWATQTRERLRKLLLAIDAAYGSSKSGQVDDHAGSLAAIAATLESFTTVMSHGDLQPGNVLVGRGAPSVIIIDWEHSDRRFESYDRLVLGLGTRAPKGLTERIRGFIAGDRVLGFESTRDERGYRTAAAAMLVLEDLLWNATECLAGPFPMPSPDFLLYRDELPGIVQVLAGSGPRR